MTLAHATQTAASLAPAALTAAEYFAGVGLFRMGLEAAGWNVVFANDWDDKKTPMYEGFFADGGGCRHMVADVHDLRAKDIPPATLATCSFPCVDLSLAGKQGGIYGRESGAFWGFFNILQNTPKTRLPRMLLLENVPGFLTANNGEDFLAVIRALNALDYACDAFFVNALHFVPQSRARVFVLALAGDAPAFCASRLAARAVTLAPARLKRALNAAAAANCKLASLRLPPPPPLLQGGLNDRVIERLAEDSPLWWNKEKLAHHLAMLSPAHARRLEGLRRGTKTVYRAFYRRRRAEGQRAEIRNDDIAGCLRTAAGGSGRQFVVAAGKNRTRMRAMTPREYARLQGVPDSLPIRAGEKVALSAFGDAVCAPAIKWIGDKILTPLVGRGRRGGL